MVEQIKAYKNAYGDIFKSKEEAEIQEKITKNNLELEEAENVLRETISFIENQKTGDRFNFMQSYLEVRHLVEPSSRYIGDNEDYQQTEKIIALITTIINLRRTIKRLENKIL